MSLEQAAYHYKKALKETPSQGGMYGKNPANVPSNIIGGLGLFYAAPCTVSDGVVVEQ